MNVARPYGVISHPLDSAVLHVLTGTTGGLTGRRVAQLAREGSQQGIGKALGRLVDEGIVEQEEVGSAIRYQLNRDHLAAAPVEQLMSLRRNLFSRLGEAIARWEIPPVHSSVFGSTARGDGNTDSDIDLFVVRPAEVDGEDSVWLDQVDQLRETVRGWTGNRASISDVWERDLPALLERRPPVVDGLEADSVRLTGPYVTELFEAASR